MKRYIIKLFETRHFWWCLAKADLRNRYRRSVLGILWTFLQPLLMTSLLVFIFGSIFKSSIMQLIPYIYSGMIAWEVISSSFIGGSTCIISSESYIRQFSHPLAIYSLKQSVVSIINFLISGLGVLLWCGVLNPSYIMIMLLSLPMTVILMFCFSWSTTTISAIINTKYRDFQQIIGLIVQAAWFVSPVYFERSVFTNANLKGLLVYNPIASILNIVRMPLLEGRLAPAYDYIFSIAIIVVFAMYAIYLLYKNDKDLIFYI